LLRAVRAGQHPRIHPGIAVITVDATDELTVLRAYESGSDHHLAEDSGYLLLRAVLAAVMRRTLQTVTSRQLHVGEIQIEWPHAACMSPATSSISAAWSSSC
jgi:DNA-binding response OmpR family regulator